MCGLPGVELRELALRTSQASSVDDRTTQRLPVVDLLGNSKLAARPMIGFQKEEVDSSYPPPHLSARPQALT